MAFDRALLPTSLLRARWLLARTLTKLPPDEVKMPAADRDVLERVVFRAARFVPDAVPGFGQFTVATGSDKGNVMLACRRPAS